MGDKAHAVSDGPRDWLAELADRIPGFVGYEAREQRRAADKLVRDAMVSKLDNLRDILADVIEQANDAETSVVDDISKILRIMNELRDKIEFMAYGETVFLSDDRLEPAYLARVYQLETQMYDHLDELETVFESPKDLGRRDTLRDIRKRLDTISQEFNTIKETLKSSQL